MASEYTQNYNLDLYVDSDKPNLRDQYNGAMRKIDAQLLVQSNAMSNTNTAVGNLTTSVTNMQTQVTANKAASEKNTSDIATLSTKVNGIDTTTNGLSDTVAEHATQIAANTTAITGNGQLIQAANTEISNETVRAKAAESRIENKVDTETTRATNAETQLSGRITANENAIAELQEGGGGGGSQYKDVITFTHEDCTFSSLVAKNATKVFGWYDPNSNVLTLNITCTLNNPSGSSADIFLPNTIPTPSQDVEIGGVCKRTGAGGAEAWGYFRIYASGGVGIPNKASVGGATCNGFYAWPSISLKPFLPSA